MKGGQACQIAVRSQPWDIDHPSVAVAVNEGEVGEIAHPTDHHGGMNARVHAGKNGAAEAAKREADAADMPGIDFRPGEQIIDTADIFREDYAGPDFAVG